MLTCCNLMSLHIGMIDAVVELEISIVFIMCMNTTTSRTYPRAERLNEQL